MTLSDAAPITAASPTVTERMDCRNGLLYMLPSGIVYHRWYTVRVWRDADGRAFAEPVHVRVDAPWRVALTRCICGRTFAQYRARAWYCQSCERTRRTATQRTRRARHRVLPAFCQHCSSPMHSRRASGRYCSPACRQQAYRSRQGRPS